MAEDGNIEMHLSIENGKVLMLFQNDIRAIRFDPENLIAIACKMTDLAFEAQNKLKPAGETLKAELIQRHIEKLVPRLSLMLASKREDRLKSNGQLAKDVVDICLHEIFS